MDASKVLVATVNVVWFGLAFSLFALRPRRAVKMLTRRDSGTEASFEALVASLPFLGGMNLGMAVLSGAAIASWAISGSVPGWPVFLSSAVAHASQFAFNLPIALRGGRRGGAPWDIRGPMAFIFVVDALCTLLNSGIVIETGMG